MRLQKKTLNKNLTKFVLTFFVLTILSNCSPAYKLRRAKQLIASAKEEGAKIKVDTIYIAKPFEVKGKEITNTIFVKKDTTIYKTIDKIKIVEKIKHDTVYQKIICPDSTGSIKQVAAINEKIIAPQPLFWEGISAALFLLLLFIFYGMKKL